MCGQCAQPVPGEATDPGGPVSEAGPPVAVHVCSQCGGPAAAGDRAVPMYDRYNNEIRWLICAACDLTARGPYADVAVLADILACTRGEDAALQGLLHRLATEPAPHPCAAVPVGYGPFARRLDGLGPYHRLKPMASPADRPGLRWWHLTPTVVNRIVADLHHAQYLRTPVPAPGGGGCQYCPQEMDLPGRWGMGPSGAPACGACCDRQKAAPEPDRPPTDVRRMMAGG